jgi:hypothetical protein
MTVPAISVACAILVAAASGVEVGSGVDVSVGKGVKVGSEVFVGEGMAVAAGLNPARVPHAMSKMDTTTRIYGKRFMKISSWLSFFLRCRKLYVYSTTF